MSKIERSIVIDRPRLWKVDNSWDKLKAEFDNDYMTKLDEFLCSEHDHGFYPEEENIFKAFDATPLHRVDVVILGRDPYFRAGQATGLAFAVPAIRNSRADEPGVRRPLRVLPPGVAA